MEYKTLKSAKVLGALSSLIAVLESYNSFDDAMIASGLKQRYLTGDITLPSLKTEIFPLVVYAVRKLTASMREFESSPEVWKTTMLDYKYYLDQVLRFL